MAFDYTELVRLIRFKFDTQENFAKALGIGRVSLNQRLNNKLDFSQEEILKASELLGIQTKFIPKYFFKEKV
ncbi:DUF739 family protein [Clostridium sp. Marseille-P3244]|uniref:DUF739 family protein n=1 Tax=Clostridium sp. Marseille-P3244 TaxID=1871020 RepID=UPI00092FFE30|nr:DUF739 family protein [Clostridium sp. Marseille-P3244]